MGPNGEQAGMTYRTQEGGSVARIEWFSSSRRILYGRESLSSKEPHGNVESRSLAGGSPTLVLSSNMISGDQEIQDGYLLPDGRFIYALAEQGINGPSCNYWQMQIDTMTGEASGKAKQLTNWPGVCMDHLSATADGKRLVFTKFWTERGVYVANLEAHGMRLSAPRRLTLSDADELPVAWAPDSKAVIFESNLNGAPGIFRQELDKDAAEPIISTSVASSPATAEEENRAAASVSPDGLWLLYPVFPRDIRASDTADLMRARLSGGAAQLVFRAPLYDAPRCTKLPANFCVLAELAPGGGQLIFTKFDPVEGRANELTRFEIGPNTYTGNGDDTSSNGFVWDLSPDGNRIAVLKRREGQIHVLSITGRTAKDITVKGWGRLMTVNWSADATGLFVSSRRKDSSVLLHVDLQGNSRIIWEQKGWIGTRGIPSPDGRHLAISSVRLNNNVWMMENF